MDFQYYRNGQTYRTVPAGNGMEISTHLAPGVYAIDADLNGMFLTFRSNGLPMHDGERSYDVTGGLIERICRFWRATSESLGVLFTGIKGSGKTYAAMMIARELGLPVILVTKYSDGLQEFISTLSGEAVIIFDEFEKLFDENTAQTTLLSITDGILKFKPNDRKLFVFTANAENCINDNFISRPGRIRYHMRFDTIANDVLRDIISDNISDEHRDKIPEIVGMFNSMHDVTVDIVREVVREVNVFGFDRDDIERFMNVSFNYPRYMVYVDRWNTNLPDDDELIERFKDMPTHLYGMESFDCNPATVRIGDCIDGERIVRTIDDNHVIVTAPENDGSYFNYYFFPYPSNGFVSRNAYAF